MAFTKATKKQAKLRLALEAPAGYGKTYTALLVGTQMLEGSGKRIAYLDTEGRGQGSASKYAHLFDFDVDEIKPPFHPQRIVESISDAVAGDYGVWICDSWSHFWQGKGGMLDIVDQVARAKYRNDSHRAWGDEAVSDLEQNILDTLLGAPLHVIVCARMKTDYVREEYEKDGQKRTRIRKAGLKAVQREGFDYEFDLVGKFETPMILTVDKTRIETFPPDTFIEKPAYRGDGSNEAGRMFVPNLKSWLDSGEANEALERPDGKEQKQLSDALKALASAQPEAPGQFETWEQVAEAYAKREFGHGIAALTKTEHSGLVAAMKSYLAQVGSADDPQEVAA